jgi:hypothetical protein
MHYRNGREAKVGDRVVGRCFNTQGLVAGTLVSLTPGPDACSAKVAFLETFPLTQLQRSEVRSPGFVGTADKIVSIQGTEHHGNYGVVAATVAREDYTECKNLLHADDVAAVGALLAEVA